MNKDIEMKSSTNWDAKAIPLQEYEKCQNITFLFTNSLTRKKGLRKTYNPFKTQLYVLSRTVMGQFDPYLASKEFIENYGNLKVKAQDYANLPFENPDPKRLLLLQDVLYRWLQNEGNFATLIEKKDPREGW